MQKEEIVIEDGTVSWFYGEQVPAGFYWVVLDAVAAFERDGRVDDKWFATQWQGAILTAATVVTLFGACFVQRETPRAYKLKLKCFYSFEEAEKFVASGKADDGWEADYDWAGISWNLTPFKFVQEKKQHDDLLDAIKYSFAPRFGGKSWINEAYKINPKSWDFKARTSHFNEPTEQQRIAQRQVDLNSTKITKLEKELKDLRELQKLLKGLR